MPLSDGRKSQRALAAHFQDVTRGKLRHPSWVAAQAARRNTPDPSTTSALRAARLPEELREPPTSAVVATAAAVPPEAIEQPRLPSRPPPPMQPVERPASQLPSARESGQFAHLALDAQAQSALTEAVEQLVSARSFVIDQSVRQLTELAIAIARRVIAHEISIDPGIVERMVYEGLDALGQHERVLIRLGSLFAEARPALEQRLALRGGRHEVVEDPSLGDYGCIVETEFGRVDESIESRLALLLESLTGSNESADTASDGGESWVTR
jgi:flagellar assembly protein FliH